MALAAVVGVFGYLWRGRHLAALAAVAAAGTDPSVAPDGSPAEPPLEGAETLVQPPAADASQAEAPEADAAEPGPPGPDEPGGVPEEPPGPA